ncbi:MAG: L-erythro-3,5-diaminohexanoate dehydrogenase [Candidatus Wallbacteria bacterium HGW-Wallbacteria-1]|uniref:L-erythro-3,5-diaminohexanoate dehydrogenase n=1 Tax=Candidatus Wallbacteria bacterium HGW-Wallbacteria-1 TaxID=2013854 RepID=A0A2N1PL01_9BACT|nr:MAG: L-erythro-3,5-diaminohexanoate dehydrogenase [Candidatus Wallbacteria bacterium HGW-Wallbacteria-1]
MNRGSETELKGNPFGSHRVIEPVGVLPQPAIRVNNDMSRLYDNEIMVDVEILNVDSASFTQIKEQAGGDIEKIKSIILEIVNDSGKLKNPVTGSGGMFIGTVSRVGSAIEGRRVKVGDRIASLVSLSLTPLRIDGIIEVKKDIDQVVIKGQAILFESGIFAKLPEDIPGPLALAVLDVCGAPAQTARLVKSGNIVAIIGAGGKSGMLCAYEARRRAGVNGMVIGIDYADANLNNLRELGFCDHVIKLDATNALDCYEKINLITEGRLCDVVINNVNIPNTEMATILMCRDQGDAYFFSMATSFTKAALGAEGVGRDINMIMGNGYARDHDIITLNILRECKAVRELYERIYC